MLTRWLRRWQMKPGGPGIARSQQSMRCSGTMPEPRPRGSALPEAWLTEASHPPAAAVPATALRQERAEPAAEPTLTEEAADVQQPAEAHVESCPCGLCFVEAAVKEHCYGRQSSSGSREAAVRAEIAAGIKKKNNSRNKLRNPKRQWHVLQPSALVDEWWKDEPRKIEVAVDNEIALERRRQEDDSVNADNNFENLPDFRPQPPPVQPEPMGDGASPASVEQGGPGVDPAPQRRLCACVRGCATEVYTVRDRCVL